MTPRPVLTPAQAADALGVSLRTLQRLKAARAIRYVQVTPRLWGMRPDDVAAYLAERVTGGDGLPALPPKRGRAKLQHRSNVVSFTQAFPRP